LTSSALAIAAGPIRAKKEPQLAFVYFNYRQFLKIINEMCRNNKNMFRLRGNFFPTQKYFRLTG